MRVIDLASLSLAGGSGIAESKIPLWWADGTTAGTTITTSGSGFLSDSVTSASSPTDSRSKLFTLSSNWPSTLKYALEVTMYNQNPGTSYAELWDMTTNTGISSAQISTTAGSATVIRSGQVTLTPGHAYGVSMWTWSSSYNVYISDASLIIFP